jgi:hypothetical protein
MWGNILTHIGVHHTRETSSGNEPKGIIPFYFMAGNQPGRITREGIIPYFLAIIIPPPPPSLNNFPSLSA